MKKILFVISTIRNIGGIKTSLMNLLNNIDLNKYEVSLCVLSNNLSDTAIIPQKIKVVKSPKVIEIAKTRLIRENFKNNSLILNFQLLLVKFLVKVLGLNRFIYLVSKLYKIPQKYDVAISYANDIPINKHIEGSNAFVLNFINAKKKFSWIHNDPYRLGFNNSYCTEVYKGFDRIVNVSKACKDMLDEIVPEYKNKSDFVYNMMDYNSIVNKAEYKSPYNQSLFTIVTVSRVENQQKRIDRVVECCYLLKKNGFSNFCWYVVGDGPDTHAMKVMAQEKGVSDIVQFVGRKDNPYPYIKNAQILVMTSDYEAHSMVLLESLTLQTPILCINYPSASEIVKDGYNGVLVENTEALYLEIRNLLEDPTPIMKWRSYISNNKPSNDLAIKQFYTLLGD